MSTNPVPDLTIFAIRIRETGRALNENFLAGATFDATPETLAVFTDMATAFVVMRQLQREVDEHFATLGFKSPCTLETFRVDHSRSDEVNAGFRIWEIDARAARCHESARQLLAEKRPTYLTPATRRSPDLGAAFNALLSKVVA